MRDLFKKTVRDIRELHPFSRQMIHGSLEFSLVLYLFALVLFYIAPYTSDILRSLRYMDAALEIAPVTFGVGIISALVSDLALRKNEEK